MISKIPAPLPKDEAPCPDAQFSVSSFYPNFRDRTVARAGKSSLEAVNPRRASNFGLKSSIFRLSYFAATAGGRLLIYKIVTFDFRAESAWDCSDLPACK